MLDRAMGVAAVAERKACNDETVARAVRQVMDDSRFVECARAISKRLKAGDAVAMACAQVEMFRNAAIR
jgi:UDP:flavonoid glycosyltransferase YjiC (YdhE family)